MNQIVQVFSLQSFEIKVLHWFEEELRQLIYRNQILLPKKEILI